MPRGFFHRLNSSPLSPRDRQLLVEDVSLSFGGVRALHQVSLKVNQGEITAIIGPNGAGKTSLLNCISGLYHPQEGRIRFYHDQEYELTRMKPHQTLETVRTGVGATWKNPDSGNRYTVVPTRTYESSAGPCREYSIDAIIEGRRETVYGTACRQPDGTWRTQG